jgi:hypothetical protein
LEFLYDINLKAAFGAQGKVAAAFGKLLWCMSESDAAVPPKEFRRALGAHSPTFEGDAQEDASELLKVLLEVLGEDLNRVVTKTYVENPEVTATSGDATMTASQRAEAEADVAAECWRTHALLREDHFLTALFGSQSTSCKTASGSPWMVFNCPEILQHASTWKSTRVASWWRPSTWKSTRVATDLGNPPRVDLEVDARCELVAAVDLEVDA